MFELSTLTLPEEVELDRLPDEEDDEETLPEDELDTLMSGLTVTLVPPEPPVELDTAPDEDDTPPVEEDMSTLPEEETRLPEELDEETTAPPELEEVEEITIPPPPPPPPPNANPPPKPPPGNPPKKPPLPPVTTGAGPALAISGA